MKPASDELVAAAASHVQQYLSKNMIDSSHDIWHIRRVCNISRELARMSDNQALAEHDTTIQLCALLHDLADWKYSGSENLGSLAVRDFLKGQRAQPSLIDAVTFVTSNIGFKEALHGGVRPVAPCPEAGAILDIVQDADRIDALGALPDGPGSPHKRSALPGASSCCCAASS